MGRLTVAVVGSGFAGSILARALNRQGHRVMLCERDRHPRFALGESSTPLAALSLERLAARYDLPDLGHLAAYGRWLHHLPRLRRGLKRGFTFYFQRPDEPFRNGPSNESRLLVAASPSDSVADSHWLREDVDAFLVERAVAEGVEYLDRLELEACEHVDGGLRLTGKRVGRSLRLDVDFVADASGAGGFLAGQFLISRRKSTSLQTDLVFGHFEGVGSFPDVASAASGAAFTAGPYPDERAAVHHLLEEGWMYVLPFDHGVVSAGVLLDRSADATWLGQLDALAPAGAWEAVLGRYPTLRDQFGDARPVRPIGRIRGLQRRLSRATGENWALLPHTYAFLSPLFSTGIAWSLLAVERLALIAEGARHGRAWAGRLGGYAAVLEAEADHLQRLVPAAYRLRRDFDLFVDYSFLYFAAVSYAEAAQRLLDRPAGGEAWAWEPFLGARDRVIREALDRTVARVGDLADRTPSDAERRGFTAAIRDAIAPRNVAGLAEAVRKNLYPVDLACLIRNARLLGLTSEDVRRNLGRLREPG